MRLPLIPFNGTPLRPAAPSSNRLSEMAEFGSDPGRLRAWTFVPDDMPDHGLPLVVVLHGCTQTAAGYDLGSGWSELADSYGFALLFPEQQWANNANLCFNWFEPRDTRRDAGEAYSIAQMIEAMVASHGIDPERVFISGLSAGGAMSAVMLALYPEVFAGGAILAGLPHGAAASVQEAFQQMRSPSQTRRSTGASIRKASGHSGSWPAVAIWHGTADTVVSPSNADAIVLQWLEVHKIASQSPDENQVDGHRHRLWRDAEGAVVVEEYRIRGMGHGTPLATTGECGCGEAGAFMLEVGISSTVQSAKTWGLLNERREEVITPAHPAVGAAGTALVPQSRSAAAAMRPAPDGITRVIEDALRTAGLMRGSDASAFGPQDHSSSHGSCV